MASYNFAALTNALALAREAGADPVIYLTDVLSRLEKEAKVGVGPVYSVWAQCAQQAILTESIAARRALVERALTRTKAGKLPKDPNRRKR